MDGIGAAIGAGYVLAISRGQFDIYWEIFAISRLREQTPNNTWDYVPLTIKFSKFVQTFKKM